MKLELLYKQTKNLKRQECQNRKLEVSILYILWYNVGFQWDKSILYIALTLSNIYRQKYINKQLDMKSTGWYNPSRKLERLGSLQGVQQNNSILQS